MNRRVISAVILGLFFAGATATAEAPSPNIRREMEKAGKETLPRAVQAIEESIDAKVSLAVDGASFGEDEKAWSNLALIAQRIVAALGEVGKDQVGKDAIAKNVQKIVIVKLGADRREDGVVLQDGIMTVQTTATDAAVAVLQSVTTKALEKLLP